MTWNVEGTRQDIPGYSSVSNNIFLGQKNHNSLSKAGLRQNCELNAVGAMCSHTVFFDPPNTYHEDTLLQSLLNLPEPAQYPAIHYSQTPFCTSEDCT
jgi:hypothetical protein